MISLSTIPFVMSDATCVMRVDLKNGLIQPFWLIFTVVIVNTCTFSQKTPSERNLLWTPISRLTGMPTKFSWPAFYLDRSSIRFLTNVFFIRHSSQVNTRPFFRHFKVRWIVQYNIPPCRGKSAFWESTVSEVGNIFIFPLQYYIINFSHSFFEIL